MIDFEHSPLGGSAAKRFLNCGSSFLLQRLLMLAGEYEEPPTSDFADKGTAAHELGASCLLDRTEPYEYVGEKIGNYTIHPDDLDPNAVAIYVATCEAIMANGPGNIIIEQTIHMDEIHPLFKGTIDFGFWNSTALWLVDYKNGEGIGVQAYRCEQLLYYALLLIMKFPELRNMPRDFTVHLGIVQPNYYGLFEDPEFWITSIGEVVDWGSQVLLPAMTSLLADKREMLPEDEFVSGDHCQFCPVMLDCPKLRHAFVTYAHGEDFLEMLSNTELSDLYALRDDARRYGNELEKVVFARKVTGCEVPSAKLVEKQTRRIFKAGAEPAAAARFGEFAYEPKKLKSPAQIEKLSSDGKAFALEWGFKPDSDRLTVAPLSDRRPEVTPKGNAEIFKSFASPVENLTDLGW
jgi:hypothetical protein